MARRTRRKLLATAGLGVAGLAGCTGLGGPADSVGGSDGDGGGSGGNGTGGTAVEDDDSGSGGSAPPTVDERLPLPMSPPKLREAARPGGPSKDGIPSIDAPAFTPAGAADFLSPGDPVFGVVRDGEAKAYPQKILVQHEIVNDELAGDPVSVTYCPLTGTVQGFERGDTEFGVSGRLINNNLVMYDRATEAWWPQVLATSIPAPWNEAPGIATLREFRLVWTTWERWRRNHPGTRVLTTDTGYAKNYGRDPYGGYNPRAGYYADATLLFPSLPGPETYDRKRVVMGARTPDGAAAFLKDALRERAVMSGRIGDTPVVAVYDDRLDTAYGYLNPDVATVESVDGSQVLVDGSNHPPDDLPLEALHTFDAMWFAWAGYYPDTTVYE
jgi:hypothetical protein